MNSSRNSTKGKRTDLHATDPIDKLIFERGLRARHLVIDKKLDLILLILNNGEILKDKISSYPRLQKASSKSLENWQLTAGGTGVSWRALNEDLSVKGFIQSSSLNEVVRQLTSSIAPHNR